MLNLTENTFETEVLNAEGLVFVDFWSPKCPGCVAVMPVIEEFTQKNEGRAKFCKLDAFENRKLSISQKVMSIPTVIFYKNGKRVHKLDSEDLEMTSLQTKLDELLNA